MPTSEQKTVNPQWVGNVLKIAKNVLGLNDVAQALVDSDFSKVARLLTEFVSVDVGLTLNASIEELKVKLGKKWKVLKKLKHNPVFSHCDNLAKTRDSTSRQNRNQEAIG